MDTDHSLRFALHALRSGFVSRDRMLGALAAGAAEPATPLPELLVARGWLDPADRDTVERHAASATPTGSTRRATSGP